MNKHGSDKTQTEPDFINRLVEAILGIASQQRPQTSSALFEATTSNTLLLDGKNKTFELTFDSNLILLSIFLEDFNECSVRAFRPIADQMIDSLLSANLLTDLKLLSNQVYSEKGTYDQIVTQIERELELSDFETDGDLPILTTTITTTTATMQNQPQNTDMPQRICRYCRKPGPVPQEF